MEIVIISAALVAMLALLVTSVLVAKKPKKISNFSYKTKAVMTPVERKLYYSIQETLKDEKVIVLAQVNMSSFLDHRGKGARNYISQKSVDFLICDRRAFPIVAIELQDKTHNSEDRKKSDEVKAAVLKNAQIPLVLFDTRSMPTVAVIKRTIEPYIMSTRNK